MPTERNSPGSASGSEKKSAALGCSGDAEKDAPSSTDGAAGFPHDSSSRAEGDQSDTVGKGKSRLSNAVTFGAAGAAGGGVAGTLVGWGGVGVAAAGGAVGFSVVVPVVVGAAAGVGVVAAARALREPVGRAASAVRHRVGNAAPEETEEGASGETSEASAVDSGAAGGESGVAQAVAAARAAVADRAAAGAAVVGGAAAVVAGASLIPKLRRRVFRNAEPGHIRVPPQARTYLYEKQQGSCTGCDNLYLFKDMTLDHIVPRFKGGTNALENLQLLCHHCNAVKGARSWDRFLKAKQPPTPDTD